MQVLRLVISQKLSLPLAGLIFNSPFPLKICTDAKFGQHNGEGIELKYWVINELLRTRQVLIIYYNDPNTLVSAKYSTHHK